MFITVAKMGNYVQKNIFLIIHTICIYEKRFRAKSFVEYQELIR